MKKAKKMRIELRKLSELKHPKRNARMHPDNQIAEMKRSVEKNGLTRMLVIDESGVIWIGNGLYQALVELGYEEAYCIVKEGMTERDLEKMMYSDNRIFDLGVDDMQAFEDFVNGLDDYDVPGFDEALLKSMKATEDDIDDMLSEYGLITPDRREKIDAAAENYRKEAEEPAEAQPQRMPQRNPETAEAGGSFIICPKCGEKIWL